jgi:hypothetical protein
LSPHIEEFWKMPIPIFGATGNFNHQILPYGILFLTFINTNVFYLLSFKFCDVTIAVSYIISALISCNFIIKNYVSRKITSYIFLLIFTKSLWLHVKHFIDTAIVTSQLFRKSFYCRYDPRMDYAFCLLTLKSSEKCRSPFLVLQATSITKFYLTVYYF